MAEYPTFRDLTGDSFSRRIDIPRGPIAAPELMHKWTESRPSSWTYLMVYRSRRGHVVTGALSAIAGLAALPIVLLGTLEIFRGSRQLFDVLFHAFFLYIMISIVLIAPALLMAHLIANWRVGLPTSNNGTVRDDDARFPIPVERTAQVELINDKLVFLILEQGHVVIAELWTEVGQFSRAETWSLFGTGGQSPVKEPWHAIVMAPPVGYPLLISSSIDQEALIYDRLTALNAKFGPEARATFLRKRLKPVREHGADPKPTDARAGAGSIPDQL